MYNFKIIDKNQKVLIDKHSSMIYYYKCIYATHDRISDITIGDFWGLDKNSRIYDDESRGISVVIPNTKKGEEFIEKIKNDVKFEERSLDEAYRFNGQLNSPVKKNYKYYKYKNNYIKLGYKKTMKMLMTPKEKIKFYLKNNKIINGLYSKIH